MTEAMRAALHRCETDVDGALGRMAGNEALYITCLRDFLRDMTVRDLETALNTQSWDEAFTAAHALKGLAGNMGFVPLFHSAAELVLMIRDGRIGEITECFRELMWCYRAITTTIREYCGQ